MDINSQHHNLLGNQISPNSEIFVFWRSFWIQNGRHSKPKWSQYGAAYLTPCKYPFSLKSFHFWIVNDFLKFLYWRPFWKFLKQRAQLWVMIYFCVKFQKDPQFGVNLTFFAPWLPWQRPPFWIYSTPQKVATHYGWYSYKASWSLIKEIKKKIPPFLFPRQLRQNLSNRFRFFLAYLVPLDVDVVPIKIHQFLLWSFLCFSFF